MVVLEVVGRAHRMIRQTMRSSSSARRIDFELMWQKLFYVYLCVALAYG